MNRKKVCLLAVGAALLASCSVYHPQAVDMPLLREAGETRLDVAAGISGMPAISGPYMGATVSHAFGDWFSAQGHAEVGGRALNAMLAAGAYLPVGERFVVEGFAGVAGGYMMNSVDFNTTLDGKPVSYGGHYAMPYLQVDMGWRRLWIFEVGAGVRGGLMLPAFDYFEMDPKDNNIVLKHVHYTQPNLVLEPALQVRLGSENVMFNLRLGMSLMNHMNQSTSEEKGNLTYDIFTLSTGINFKL